MSQPDIWGYCRHCDRWFSCDEWFSEDQVSPLCPTCAAPPSALESEAARPPNPLSAPGGQLRGGRRTAAGVDYGTLARVARVLSELADLRATPPVLAEEARHLSTRITSAIEGVDAHHHGRRRAAV
jgi:hypothetical protein